MHMVSKQPIFSFNAVLISYVYIYYSCVDVNLSYPCIYFCSC